jgi:hypothetical protein
VVAGVGSRGTTVVQQVPEAARTLDQRVADLEASVARHEALFADIGRKRT